MFFKIERHEMPAIRTLAIVRCERPRCQIDSDAGQAMRATKLPSALVPKQSVKMRCNSRKQTVIDLLTSLGSTIVDNFYIQMFCSQMSILCLQFFLCAGASCHSHIRKHMSPAQGVVLITSKGPGKQITDRDSGNMCPGPSRGI